jgi:hypothetical protein
MAPQQRIPVLFIFAATAIILINGLLCTLRCY